MTQQWEKQRERGSLFMLRLLILLALKLGRRFAHLLLYPIVGYFLLTSPRGKRASRNALRRFLGREPRFSDVARHFYTFAACSIDRLYLLTDNHGQFHIETHRPPEVAEISSSGGGCLLLTTHLGGFEPLRAIGTFQRHLPLSFLMDRKQGEMLVSLLERLNPGIALQIIDAAQRGPQLVLQLKDALRAGRMVGMGAERALADERAFEVNFMGGKVRFREAPWVFAAALDTPVILGFGLYRGGNRYEAHFELFSRRITASRHNRAAELQAHAQRYAERLEYYARLAPYNWFNFYDYWADEPADQ